MRWHSLPPSHSCPQRSGRRRGGADCARAPAGGGGLGAVGPACCTVPSGWVMVSWRSGVRVRSHAGRGWRGGAARRAGAGCGGRWDRRVPTTRGGAACTARIGPGSRGWRRCGTGRGRARRWARLASRVERPRLSCPGVWSTTPWWTTTGWMSAMSNRRRSTSVGSSTGNPQSTVGAPVGSGLVVSTTTTTSGRPPPGPVPSHRAARAWARRKPWRSTGSVGQCSGTCSANSAATVADSRPCRRRPVSGSNRPARHHMPSPSIQVCSRVARCWRSRRASPSSRWMTRTSVANVRCSSSGVDRGATCTS